MIDVNARCGMARMGLWRTDELELALPEILYFVSDRFPTTDFKGATITSSAKANRGLTVFDQGSRYYPIGLAGRVTIAPDLGLPVNLGANGPEDSEPGLFKVVSNVDHIVEIDSEGVVLGGGASYLRSPREFADGIVKLRAALGPSRALYVPGIAVPSNLALLIYSGVDVVDSLTVLFEASRGRWLNQDGSYEAVDGGSPPCRCSGCISGSGKMALVEHNETALWEELELVKRSIAGGRLREHVENRSVNSPWNVAVLRHLDLRHYDVQERHTPVTGVGVKAYSPFALTRPEIVRYRKRVKERYSKPPSARILLLLPCSAKKPYSLSKSHAQFRDVVRATGNPWAVHEVVVTSPLGIVPRELEVTYPARGYDIPVTGDWSKDEIDVVQKDVSDFLKTNEYDRIIAHLDAEKSFVEDALDEVTFTCKGKAVDTESLSNLADELSLSLEGLEKVPRKHRLIEDMSSLSRFQFGPGGEGLLEHATLQGRDSEIRILKDSSQLAMLSNRGLLSLTLEGGRILSDRDLYCVEIDDFYLRGDVFAIGVMGASDEIRVGDDVVVRHGGEVRAVGLALMPAAEMVNSKRGKAVKVRHVSKPRIE